MITDEGVLNSSLSSQNPTLKLLRTIGSPFSPKEEIPIDSCESLKLYNLAVRNKIPILYLETLKQQGKLSELEAKYEEEKAKYLRFIEGVTNVSKILDAGGIEYVIYKTIKPYPAVPVDIDIITLGNDDMHRKAAKVLLAASYKLALPGVIKTGALVNDKAYEKMARLATKPTYKREHISPTGTNFIDPEYNILIDLRKELAMSYIIYMDKNKFRGHVIRRKLTNGKENNALTPDLDLACVIIHSVMEHLYLLGEYYTFLFQLSEMDEREIDGLINVLRENRITVAAKAFITITVGLYQAAYGAIPEKLYMISNKLGLDMAELENVRKNDFNSPHRYKISTIARTLLEKTKEKRFSESVLIQMLNMLNPKLLKLVLSELVARRKRETYL